jgi:hypothetical protein
MKAEEALAQDGKPVDPEYLCLSCGVNQATHEYCDDCLQTIKGDWAILSSSGQGFEPDWVVHVTEEQEQYGYVADAIEQMLDCGRSVIQVVCHALAQEAPSRREPEPWPARESYTGALWLEAGGRLREVPLGDYAVELNDALERYGEARLLSEVAMDARADAEERLLQTAPVGPLSRPSSLAERTI